MIRSPIACAVVFGDYPTCKAASYNDIREIVSKAEECRSKAITESLKDYPNILGLKER